MELISKGFGLNCISIGFGHIPIRPMLKADMYTTLTSAGISLGYDVYCNTAEIVKLTRRQYTYTICGFEFDETKVLAKGAILSMVANGWHIEHGQPQ